jgi:hypothetical protein
MIRLTLTLSALYPAVIGIALMVLPLEFGVGAVPADASPELISLIRLLGGPFLGIGALNWLSRRREPNALRDVLLANLIGFGAVALNDLWGVASGEAREIAKIFLIIHWLFVGAFALAMRLNRRSGPKGSQW